MPFSFPGSYNTKWVMGETGEIQEEEDKRVREKGLWRKNKQTKGRRKR